MVMKDEPERQSRSHMARSTLLFMSRCKTQRRGLEVRRTPLRDAIDEVGRTDDPPSSWLALSEDSTMDVDKVCLQREELGKNSMFVVKSHRVLCTMPWS